MKEMYELVCEKCGKRVFQDSITAKCRRVTHQILPDVKTICGGKNRVASVSLVR